MIVHNFLAESEARSTATRTTHRIQNDESRERGRERERAKLDYALDPLSIKTATTTHPWMEVVVVVYSSNSVPSRLSKKELLSKLLLAHFALLAVTLKNLLSRRFFARLFLSILLLLPIRVGKFNFLNAGKSRIDDNDNNSTASEAKRRP